LECGWNLQQVADVAAAIVAGRRATSSADELFDLVLSGPDVPGIATRDTGAVMHALLSEARREVLLVGYAIHNAAQIFEPLAQRMAADPLLRVWCCLDIRRSLNDTSHSSEIVRRFVNDFNHQHWPWSPKPTLYYDPRSLEPYGRHRSSLHAKCVVVDRNAALVTSANFTEAAQERNVECGIVIRHQPLVERLARYFDALCQTDHLISCDLTGP
jgi:phosphatidylserine/phosphatidylglycerophosphate/cardiolipin synthase-like enzyme